MLLFEADRAECGVNYFTLIPAAAIVDLIQLATVSVDTVLDSFNYVINNEVILLLISFVVSRYVFKQNTGYMFLFKR